MELDVVSLYSGSSIEMILGQLEPLWGTNALNLTLDLEYYDFARPYQLLVVGCFVRSMQARGRLVNLKVKRPINDDVHRYVSRMDFYRMVGLNVEENFRRRDPSGRFVELTCAQERQDRGDPDAVGRVSEVIAKNFAVPRVTLAGLYYSLVEIVANVHSHACSPIAGWIAAQNYEDRVEVCIADAGQGIAQSLRTNPLYAGLSEGEALLRSIERNVTRSSDQKDGMGMGLYHTSEILRRSGGRMQIYSGSHAVRIADGEAILVESPPWNGTIVSMEFRKDTAFDEDELYAIFDGKPGVLVEDALVDSVLW